MFKNHMLRLIHQNLQDKMKLDAEAAKDPKIMLQAQNIAHKQMNHFTFLND